MRTTSATVCRFLIPTLILLASPLPGEESPKARADALVRAGLELGGDNLEEAADRYRTARELYREAGDLRGQAHCWLYLATIEDQRGETASAVATLRESLALLRRLDDGLGAWVVLTLIGDAENRSGRHQEARRDSEEALEVLAALEDSGAALNTETIEAFAEQTYCPNAAGWKGFASVPPALQTVVLRVFRALNFQAIAGAERELGHPEAALEALRQALELSQPMGLLDDEIHRSMADTYQGLGKHDEAREHLEAILEIARQSGDWEREVEILNEIADLERRQGRRDAAIERYREVLEIAQLMGHEELEAKTIERMEEVRREMGRGGW